MTKGTVRWFDASKGFGFIQPQKGEDIFVHIKDVRTSERKPLEQGQQVAFAVAKVANGYRAVDVVVTAQATVRSIASVRIKDSGTMKIWRASAPKRFQVHRPTAKKQKVKKQHHPRPQTPQRSSGHSRNRVKLWSG